VVGPPLRVRKRSEKVERRELEVVIEFRFEGIVDSNGDFFADCCPPKDASTTRNN
jgi:hypothetical protein